jgi:hypothetical protein
MPGPYIAGSLVTIATYATSAQNPISNPIDGFRDRTGALADPNTVTVKYRRPDGTVVSITYPDIRIVRDNTGLYRTDVDTTGEAGQWTYEWLAPEGDPVQSIAANAFTTSPAPI